MIYHLQYLKLARTLEGYGELTFPHCACDARKDGHVMVIVGLEALKMQACKEDGTIEVFFLIDTFIFIINTNIINNKQQIDLRDIFIFHRIKKLNSIGIH